MEHDEILVAFGGEIKSMGEGRYRGQLVRYGNPDEPDISGARDFFAPDTDFGAVKTVGVYWDHGMDPKIGAKRVGEGEIVDEEDGLWLDFQLNRAEKYVQKYVEPFVLAGKGRFSSGSAAHLVRRERMPNGTHKILVWPIAEASITPEAAEPRLGAIMPIKSYKATRIADEEAEGTVAQVEGKSTPTAEADSEAQTEPDVPAIETKTETDTMSEQQNPQAEVPAWVKTLLEKQDERLAAAEAKATELAQQFEASKTSTKAITEVPSETKAAGIIRKRGDSQMDAFAHWVKTGDKGAVAGLLTYNDRGQEVVEIKASNATDMNTTTAADGGNTVTDDMANEIVRRADEMSLATRAGVRRFRSSANVLDIPLDGEADSEFVATTEANDFDQDAPAIGQKVLTKVAYTKYVDVSYQLMEASTPDVMGYIMDRVAIGKAKTDNDLLITEVETNGTQYKIFAGTAAIAVDELEPIALNNTNAWYVQNPSDAKWIMAPATHQAIQVLDDTSIRRYLGNQQGGPREILGSEVLYSNKCQAIGSGLKPVLFGNFNYVAQLEDPSLQFLRDPYTVAIKGQTRLLWYYRTAFGVLQSAAVGYGRNITT